MPAERHYHDPADLDHLGSGPAPHRRRLLLVLGLGVVAIAAAVGFRVWQASQPVVEESLPGRDPDPAWAKREREVQQQVQAVLAAPPSLDDTPAHPVTPVPANTQPDLSAFRIAEDHRTYDLRGWKPVKDADGPHASGVRMVRRLKLTKLAAADRIDFLTRTSGTDLVVRLESPKPEAARVFASQAKPVVQGKEMTELRLSADVAHVPVGGEFELTYRTTYWNSLQTPEEQWFGTIGYDGSTLLSMLILFPEGRPFQGGGLRTGPADGEVVPYDGTQIVFKGPHGSWVYWEVPGPKTGNIYRLEWKW